MKKSVYLLVVCNMLYVRSAPTDSEMVWLKDVTTSFETEKRTLSDLDLPNELTFHLGGSSHDMTLQLKRNHGINPNADVYVMRKLKNGRSHREKARNLGKEEVAYYQDRDNGAFMTVRCVKRSNGQCDRVINGNVRIGDRNYDLRPAETDVTSRNVLNVPDLGKRYVLHDQAHIQRDAAKAHEKNVQQEIIDLLRRSPHQQDNRNHFIPIDSKLSSRNVSSLYNSGTADKRNKVKNVYWIEVGVLIDSTIWNWYLALVQAVQSQAQEGQVIRKIREAYSHLINGVHLIYQEIKSPRIDISVTLREFYIFQTSKELAFGNSQIKTEGGKTKIDANYYLKDIGHWDEHVGSNYEIDYDHLMLFTKHDLYEDSTDNNDLNGLSKVFGVCDPTARISIVQVEDYFETVRTAAHELGHNLGADHDGDDDTMEFPAENFFIMSPIAPIFDPDEPYSRNPWLFSNDNVLTFYLALRNKDCVKNKGVYFNEDEWRDYVKKQPGEVYSLNEQCEHINGPKSVFCGFSRNSSQHYIRLAFTDAYSSHEWFNTSDSKILCLQEFVSSCNVQIQKRKNACRILSAQIGEPHVEQISGARKDFVCQKLRNRS